MEKAKHLRQKRLRRQRRWAALFIVLALAGGGAALQRAAGFMAAICRAKVFTPMYSSTRFASTTSARGANRSRAG